MKESFGERFLRLRKEKGYTQEEIGAKLNISPQAVSKWEKDVSAPDISNLLLIAKIFEISVDELLGDEKKAVVAVEKKKVDIDRLILKIKGDFAGEMKMNVNLPVSVIIPMIKSGVDPDINFGGRKDINIDFNLIMSLIEKGVLGRLVEIEGGEGNDRFSLYVDVVEC